MSPGTEVEALQANFKWLTSSDNRARAHCMMPAHTVSYHDLYFKLTCDYAAAAIPVAGGPDVMLQMQSTRCSGVSARAGLAGSVAAGSSAAAAQKLGDQAQFPERPKKR